MEDVDLMPVATFVGHYATAFLDAASEPAPLEKLLLDLHGAVGLAAAPQSVPYRVQFLWEAQLCKHIKHITCICDSCIAGNKSNRTAETMDKRKPWLVFGTTTQSNQHEA